MARRTMVHLAGEYLARRRALGFALRSEGQVLLQFARHADDTGHCGPITIELAVCWAKRTRSTNPRWQARRLGIVRRFALDRALVDPRTEVPPPGLLGRGYRRPAPHIYSDTEVHELLRAASQLGPKGGLRPHTFVALLGLLASTGLRISEALRLERSTVNLDEGVLAIHETKFRKSRLVPIHQSTCEALCGYASRRDQRHPRVSSMAFFLTEHGTSLKYHKALLTFMELRRTIASASDRPPRFHDFRHTFAVRCLLRWYEEGGDIQRKLPFLSTYLGHVKVSDTYWYLSAVPELLATVSARWERAMTQRGAS